MSKCQVILVVLSLFALGLVEFHMSTKICWVSCYCRVIYVFWLWYSLDLLPSSDYVVSMYSGIGFHLSFCYQVIILISRVFQLGFT